MNTARPAPSSTRRPTPRPRPQPGDVVCAPRPTAVDFGRRRLAVATVLLAAVAFVVFTFAGGRANADGDTVEGPLRPPAVYVVQRGDSLWSIVQTLAPDRDPRPLVASLKRAAGGTELRVGQRILLPPALAGA